MMQCIMPLPNLDHKKVLDSLINYLANKIQKLLSIKR